MTTTFTPSTPVWCAGCGHFGVQNAIDTALDRVGIPAHLTAIIAGIGCSGSVQNNVAKYGYHALHGRVLPTATGLALAAPELTVIGAGGDGDGYAIGGGHLMHAFRRDAPVVCIIMNNGVYGLTKGQDSPTAGFGDDPAALDGIRLGLATGGGFLARGYASRAEQLTDLIADALAYVREHRRFAFVEALSPCVTYWDTYTVWSSTIHDLDADRQHALDDRAGAFQALADVEAEGKIPIGLVFRDDTPRPAAEASTVDAETYLADLIESLRL